MTWLLGYLMVGMVVISTAVVMKRRSTDKAMPSLSKPHSRHEQPPSCWANARECSGIALGVLLFTPFWPYVMFKELVGANRSNANETSLPKPFAVGREDLQWKTTIEEIERAARVQDPLGAVPDVPFGHLNAAWVAFRGQLTASDEVWTFVSRTERAFGIAEMREGHVIVGHDGLGGCFLRRMERVCRRANEQVRSAETGATSPATKAR
ncbi:MAG: hypothetical protein KDG55_00610 [Rhodocyclaceae bacterium]|nr:hypothetical protein [Rhodocyclaceae bacterium]